MRVLQFIDVLQRGGGAEKLVLDLSLSLKQQGIDVEVLSVLNPYSSNNGEFCDVLKRHGISVHFLHSEKLYSPINLFTYFQFLRKNKYDIIHTHLFPALYYSSFINSIYRLKSKFIYTEHNTDNRRRHLSIFKLFDKFSYRRFQAVVCITKAVETALKNHVNYNNTIVIPNGIDVSSFSKAKPKSITDIIPNCEGECKLILMNARFVEAKDHLTLLKAMKLLPQNVHLLLIGTGPLEKRYREYCHDELLTNRVHFLGVRNDVANLLKTVDLNVLSSNHEGFSLSMLESMASGKPFIASSVPGIVDIIDEIVELFPHKDEKALAFAIHKLLNDQEYANMNIRNCQNFARRFDIGKCAELHIDLYKKYLNS